MSSQDERWQKEAEFFDREEYSDAVFDPATIARYTDLKYTYLAPEYPFAVLGDVRGKRILDVGCGDGGNSVLLALKGARVTGIDLSSKAIEVARRRAANHGLESQVTFFCGPVEALPLEGSYDCIVGWAVLHHLLPVLDPFLDELVTKFPDAFYMFSEPVSMSRWLRAFRLTLPIPVHGTPDERPLELADLQIVGRHFPQMEIKLFGALTRVTDHVLSNGNFERSSWFQRGMVRFSAGIDRLLLSVLGMNSIASVAVISGRPNPQ